MKAGKVVSKRREMIQKEITQMLFSLERVIFFLVTSGSKGRKEQKQ